MAYAILFSNRMPRSAKLTSKLKAAGFVQDDSEERSERRGEGKASSDVAFKSYDQAEKCLKSAFDTGDHRTVLRCWNAFKQFDQAPAVYLPNVVESMQRVKKDAPFIIRELKAFFNKFPGECDLTLINDILESLGKRLDSQLMEMIVDMLPSLRLKQDSRTYEIFLMMHLTTRSFQEVKDMVAEMKAKQVPFTLRATIVVIKAALRMNNFEEAVTYFRGLKASWDASNAWHGSPSAAPRHIVAQLIELACKEHQLNYFLPELQGVPLTEDAVNMMLSECVRQKDACMVQRVEKLAREQGVQLSDASYSLLVKGLSGDPARVRALLEEVLASKPKGMECSTEFTVAVLGACGRTSDFALADQLYERMKPKQLPVLSAFIRFYADNERFSKACDVYEKSLMPAGNELQRPLMADARMERALMNAALRCGRSELAKHLLESSPSDVAKHIAMIRSCAAEGNLQGAIDVFESLKQSGVDLNSIVYNTVLDACVQCNDLKAAEAWMERTKEAKMTDVVSFNTLIKAHLFNNNLDKARGLMEEMRLAGLQPNRVTFNELINAAVQQQGARGQIWEIVAEMKTVGITPNQVTCSILLKHLNAHSAEDDILKTMDLIKAMEEPMDEVLLSSVVEACVRIGKPDLLADRLQQLKGSDQVAVNGSHTFGSLIKAYGHAKDVDGVWRCWKEMRSRHIKPTSITLGCMVEAVVNNGDTEGAYELIHQMQDDEQCRDALNSVIYCSVLKGFTREKKIDRVWAVYEEMNRKNVELSIVTYNTLIDACARCGRMEHVASVVENMKTHKIKPNVITYSTMLKGHCQNGDIQMGFSILEQMRKEARLKPDEIMYNSLLDGCAQNNLVEEGLHLLDEMQKEGVQPSNFTLSILVKLMNRARRLDHAFSMVTDITKKYNFRPNVHVYTNLVQACISNHQLPRGMSVLEQMVRERIQPDSRTYMILVRASISKNQFEQAVGLLRGALGLEGALPSLQKSIATCPNLDHAIVNEALNGLADRGHAQDLAVPLLSDIRQQRSKVHVDTATQRKVMSSSMNEANGVFPTPTPASYRGGGDRQRNGKGKGKGSRNPH